MKEFRGGRALPAVLTLLPSTIPPLWQPCSACTAFPEAKLQDKHNLHCKRCSHLLEVATDTIRSRENILNTTLSGACTDLGKLETGEQCLQELQLVPGADCRQKKTRISRWVRAAKSTTAESVVGGAFCTFTIQTSGLKKYHKLCLKDTLQHRSGCDNPRFCQQFPFSLYSHLYFNIPNGPPYRLHRDWILLQINHLVAASVSARRSQWLHHTPGSVLQYFS